MKHRACQTAQPSTADYTQYNSKPLNFQAVGTAASQKFSLVRSGCMFSPVTSLLGGILGIEIVVCVPMFVKMLLFIVLSVQI